MDVHIGGALCQNMDPIHNKQGNKIKAKALLSPAERNDVKRIPS
jgi:hypothetical protein